MCCFGYLSLLCLIRLYCLLLCLLWVVNCLRWLVSWCYEGFSLFRLLVYCIDAFLWLFSGCYYFVYDSFCVCGLPLWLRLCLGEVLCVVGWCLVTLLFGSYWFLVAFRVIVFELVYVIWFDVFCLLVIWIAADLWFGLLGTAWYWLMV